MRATFCKDKGECFHYVAFVHVASGSYIADICFVQGKEGYDIFKEMDQTIVWGLELRSLWIFCHSIDYR